MLSPNNIDIIIYHHPCADGFTCCTIANLYFKQKQADKYVEYLSMSHSASVNPKLYDKLAGKNVLICDFSFKKDVIEKLLKIVSNLLIIDHHISAQTELSNLDQKHKIFDMTHCGAHLTWQYFFPDVPVPLFVKYVEDNDIWLKQMPNTLEMTAFISCLEFECDKYAEFITDENKITNTAIPFGTILLKQANKQIENALNKSTVKMIDFNDNIYFTAVCNATTNTSEIGNQLLQKYEHVDFSIIYSSNDNYNMTSFRSDDTRADVSIIAAKCSGGGHRNASGCSLYDKCVPGFEIGDYACYKQLKDLDFLVDPKENYNCVCLNSTQNKTQFAKYLLQTRYQEKNIDIQEACGFYRNKNNNDSYVHFDFSLIWHYGADSLWFIMHWSDKKKYKIRELLKKTDNLEIIENKRIAKFNVKMSEFPFSKLIKNLFK
jgi:oligoribonuclease NrnB/cAMP/cGMP phosphodiesterase (DHH superfamily)